MVARVRWAGHSLGGRTHMHDAIKRTFAVVSCLALLFTAEGYSQTGAAVLSAGAGRPLNPALLGKSLPPGTGVHVWLVHPVEREESGKSDLKAAENKDRK